MNISEFAKHHNLDETSVKPLVEYLQRKAQENIEVFNKHPEMFIKVGIKKWLEQSTEYLNKLAYGTDDESVNERNKLIEEVYNQARNTN